MDLSQRLLYHVILISSLANTGFSKIEWTEQPGLVRVLAGTTATFRWYHSHNNYTDTLWSYLGTPANEQRRTIMIQIGQACTTYGSRHHRLECGIGNGNATMLLHGVTSSDQGFYEVKVIPSSLDVNYVENIAALEVYQKETFTYHITVDNTSHWLTANDNPDESSNLLHATRPMSVTAPQRINITVLASRSTPKPVIRILKAVGENQMEDQPICADHFCHRYVGFCSDDIIFGKVTRGLIIIEISFPVGNLPVQRHIIDVDVHPKVSNGPASIVQQANPITGIKATDVPPLKPEEIRNDGDDMIGQSNPKDSQSASGKVTTTTPPGDSDGKTDFPGLGNRFHSNQDLYADDNRNNRPTQTTTRKSSGRSTTPSGSRPGRTTQQPVRHPMDSPDRQDMAEDILAQIMANRLKKFTPSSSSVLGCSVTLLLTSLALAVSTL